MKLTEHFSLEEMTVSEYAARIGQDNTPPPYAVENLIKLCQKVLEPLRDVLNRPIIITSGYRCELVNTGIGGSPTSQHMKGQAADFIAPGIRNFELFQIAGRTVNYDQVIEEFGSWVHVSYCDKPRFEKLVAKSVNGRTVYSNYL